MVTVESKTENSTELPLPDASLSRPVVIYDGLCRFCTKSVHTLARLGGRSRLSFISLHDTWVTEQFADLSHNDLMKEMYLIEPDGTRTAGAAAFRRLTVILPALWLLSPLLHIPGSLPLWSFCYRQFAKIRYFFGRNQCEGDSCKIHLD